MIHRLFRSCVTALAATFVVSSVALAHPLGNFTVNHYSRIEPAGDGIRVFYVLDMAEIPTFQEQARIDGDRDGRVSDTERDAYARAKVEEIRGNLRLELEGTPTSVQLRSHVLSFPPGQGGLPTLRLEATFFSSIPGSTGRPLTLVYRDDNDPGRLGWHEIVAQPGTIETTIQQASVPAEDRSDELRIYPEDMLSSPLDVRDARVTFIPAIAGTDANRRAIPGGVERGVDVYAALAGAETLSPSVILVSLATALVLGAFHALSPGHGKTVVAAYLVGSRGTARHAVFLGATVTVTHTAGVYALGVVTLLLSEYVLPERLYPILEVVSGLLVVAVGGWLFAGRLRGLLARRRSHEDAHALGLAHVHDEGHVTTRTHAHAGNHGREHASAHDHALARVHPHAEAYARGHPPVEEGPHDHVHPHGHDHAPVVGDPHAHAHGGSAHSHLPPGADGQPVTWRSLLALGVSGGLLPCPSALVVLLSAIALHRVAFGLLLIIAFSVGLASVLVGIGLLLVYARGLLERFSVGGGTAARLLPVASAFLIMLAGLIITLQALPRVL